jgi:hypothetical protein
MHPRLRAIVDYLDAERGALESTIQTIPSHLETRRPAPERWSAAEIVDHLATVEKRIAGMFAQQVSEARARGVGAERESAPIHPVFDVKAVSERQHPRVAGPASQPRAGVTLAAAWGELQRAREALREAVMAADGLALNEVEAPHPALGPLNLYQWLIFVGAHEARHAAQIRDAIGESR